MDLINDVHTVCTYLGRYPHLFNQVSYIIYGIVGGRIQFMDIKRAILAEGFAGFTFVTSFRIAAQIPAIDGFCENSCAGCFTNTPGTTKQIGLRQGF
jgi:hypothetical protein